MKPSRGKVVGVFEFAIRGIFGWGLLNKPPTVAVTPISIVGTSYELSCMWFPREGTTDGHHERGTFTACLSVQVTLDFLGEMTSDRKE